MRTMSGGPCPHDDCSNRNSFGYCKTPVCINVHYQQEQWGLPSTTNHHDELIERILTAQEEMLKHCIEANSVTLNGRKYGKLIENLPPNIKPTIFGMAVKADYALPDDCDFLVQYEPPQPKTNADRIRTMSNEELAEFITPVKCVDCRLLDCGVEEEMLNGKHRTCQERVLDWLKEEAKDERTD